MKYNRGEFDGAADEFLKWVRGGGRILPGLVKRRSDERSLFLK
jgi:lysozyme